MPEFTMFAQIMDLSQFIVDVGEKTIRVRIADPSGYDNSSFKTIRLTTGIQAVIGRPRGSETTKVQSLLFDKTKYNPDEAQSWVKRHHGKFDKAMDMENQKMAVFDDTMDIPPEDVPNVLEEHIMYHLPPLKPSGVEKIIKMCGLIPEDMLEYTKGEPPIPMPDPEPDNDIYDILRMTPEQMDARIKQIDEMLAKIQQ